MRRRFLTRLIPPLGAIVIAVAGAGRTQEATSLIDWAKTAARGVLDLCRQDAPDAGAVADHGEVWGWPAFVPYTEHPDGYQREAGGQSRRSYKLGDATAEVEVTVQSGEVSAVEPAKVRYFRCNVAANQPIAADLEAYFTNVYGAPALKTDRDTVWLSGAASSHDGGGDDAALAATVAAGAGADGVRVELSHELDRDMAKITEFRVAPGN